MIRSLSLSRTISKPIVKNSLSNKITRNISFQTPDEQKIIRNICQEMIESNNREIEIKKYQAVSKAAIEQTERDWRIVKGVLCLTSGFFLSEMYVSYKKNNSTPTK